MPSNADSANASGRIRVIGDDLISIAVDDTNVAQRISDQLRQSEFWREAVPGIDSVVVQFDTAAIDIDAALDQLARTIADAPKSDAKAAALIEIPVCYGGDYGPDLDAVCEQLAISPAEFIGCHTGVEYPVDMLGFTPGFAYIGGLDSSLKLPRRSEPRQHVLAGSVGIAGERTGVYALPGPGGWSIVGRTPERLFDAAADMPFRLAAGMRVRFHAIDAIEFDTMPSR